jgi:hypothetical protein
VVDRERPLKVSLYKLELSSRKSDSSAYSNLPSDLNVLKAFQRKKIWSNLISIKLTPLRKGRKAAGLLRERWPGFTGHSLWRVFEMGDQKLL